MENPKWMSDESIKDIDAKKITLLKSLVEEGHNKSQKEMMSLLLSKMRYAKENKITFLPEEIGKIISAIKKYSTPQELKDMEEIMKKAPK